MGLKSVRINKKPTTPIVEPPPPPPPTNSSSSSSSSDNNTAISATSSSTSSSNAAIPTTTSTPPTTIPTIPTTTQTSSSSSDDDDDDDSSPPPPPPTKTTPISTPSKRPAETDTKLSEKRPKKDDSTGPGSGPGPSVSVAATPQKLFQRLWSNEDEIVILKGMIDYKGKKGIDPMVNIDDFLSFINKSLRVVDVKKGQIKDKIQRLKKRFFNAKKKKLSDPHEIMAFDLSKNIWGGLDYNAKNRVVVVDDDDNNNKGNNVVEEVKKGVVREEEGNDKGCFANLEFGFSGEDEVVLKEVMKRLGDREKGEVKKMVGKANEAYLEAYLLRLKVLEVAANKMLDGLRKD